MAILLMVHEANELHSTSALCVGIEARQVLFQKWEKKKKKKKDDVEGLKFFL